MSEIVEIIDGDVVVFEECNGDVFEFVANSIVVIIPELSAADLEQRLSELTAEDVDADPAGTAAALFEISPDFAAIVDAAWSI